MEVNVDMVLKKLNCSVYDTDYTGHETDTDI